MGLVVLRMLMACLTGKMLHSSLLPWIRCRHTTSLLNFATPILTHNPFHEAPENHLASHSHQVT